jgi:hypothetical protein
MARVKFNGVKKAKVTWCSMGKVYSYNVRPGEVLAIPDDQVNNIRATGSFLVVSAPHLAKRKPKVNKKVLKKEEPIKVVKLTPVVEPEPEVEVVEEPEVEEVVEEVENEEIDPDENTKVLPAPVVVEEEEEEPVVVEAEDCDKTVDYTSIRKADLKDMCKERGLHVSGNRDDLIARLVAFDKGIIIDE